MGALKAHLWLLTEIAVVCFVFSMITSRMGRFLLFRWEVAAFLFTIPFHFLYILFLVERLYRRISGENLEQFDMMRSFRFTPPTFLDLGFNDLLKYKDDHWKFRHKNFSFSASQGVCHYMEDRMHYMHDPLNQNLSIFGIFDGHGGQFVSDFLETNFALRIRQRLLRTGRRRKVSVGSNSSSEDHVEEAIITEVLNIDDDLSRYDPDRTNLTGSTLIAAILESNRWLSVVNVGDSRAVACDENGAALPLSFDHKPSNPAEKQRIERAGGFVSGKDGTDRVQGILAVSRAFGDTLLKRLGVLTAHPDVVRLDLTEKRLRFLLVGTDGFWDVLENDDAVRLANEYLEAHPKEWRRVSTFLVDEALARGTVDNVSVLFLRLR